MTPDEKRVAAIKKRVEATFKNGQGHISKRDFDSLLASMLAWKYTAKCYAAPDTDAEREALERAVNRMGWPEINAFKAEMRKGQSIFEDAGGYMMRCFRRLFGLPELDEEVVSYQRAGRAMVAKALSETRNQGE